MGDLDTTDSTFIALWQNMQPPAIVMLEDLENAPPKVGFRTGISTSTLINTLEGLPKRSGFLILITTNVFKLLDERLTRRAIHIEIPNITSEQIGDILKERFPGVNEGWIKKFRLLIPGGQIARYQLERFLEVDAIELACEKVEIWAAQELSKKSKDLGVQAKASLEERQREEEKGKERTKGKESMIERWWGWL